MIQPLTREESERTADVAAKVEEVVAAVNRQDAQLDFLLREVKRVENLVTGEGGQAADGESGEAGEVRQMRAEVEEHRRHVATVMQREAALRAERDEAQAEIAALRVENATLKATVERYEEAIACLRSNPNEWAERALVVIGTILGTPGPITPEALEWGVRKVQELGLGGEALDLDAIELRALLLAADLHACEPLSYVYEMQALHGDIPALVARVRELEKEDTERLERGREKARHMEKEIATLKHAVREARRNLDYGHIWTPNDTQYVRDAIAALSAALDEEATDAE